MQALQGNYGNFTSCWDRVFGTYLDPETIPLSQYRPGLDYDQDYLGTLTFGKLKFSARMRHYFQMQRFSLLLPRA